MNMTSSASPKVKRRPWRKRAAGKPLLTMEHLDELAKHPEANKALAAEAAKDIPGFVRHHFYLTPSQDRFLSSASKAKLTQLAEALGNVAKDGGSVKFTAPPVANPESKHVAVTVETPVGKIIIQIDKS